MKQLDWKKYWEKYWKIGAIVFAGLLVLGFIILAFIGCPKTDEDIEKIFNQTIHDFEGHKVVQFTEEEDKNFLVYAEGVRRLSTENGVNTLCLVDADSATYTFENADEEMKSLQAGDVFFMEATKENPDSVAIKVSAITVSGNTVMITNDEVSLEDLFAYADVDIPIAVENIWFDETQLEENASITVVPAGEEVPSLLPSLNVAMDASEDPNDTHPATETYIGLISDSAKLVFKQPIEISVENKFGSATVGGNIQLIMTNFRVVFRYNPVKKFFSLDVSIDAEEQANLYAEYEGEIFSKKHEFPPMEVPIPATPLKARGVISAEFNVSGKISGSAEQGATYALGIETGVNLPKDPRSGYCDNTGKYFHSETTVEGKIEFAFHARIGVGLGVILPKFPPALEAYLDAALGVRVVGKLELYDSTIEVDGNNQAIAPPFLHDCDRCIDGDVELFFEAECGLEAELFNRIFGKNIKLSINLGEKTIKIGDFYVSQRLNLTEDFEFGTGECPHKRWRVIVNVENGEGKTVSDAMVCATFPYDTYYGIVWYSKGRKSSENMTDNKGQTVFYLPNGENFLTCTYEQMIANTYLTVEGDVAEITLELQNRIYIIYEFYDEPRQRFEDMTAYGELYNQLSEQYPNAVWIPWNQVKDESMPRPLDDAESNADFQLDLGDIVIFVKATKTDWFGKYGTETITTAQYYLAYNLTAAIVVQDDFRSFESFLKDPNEFYIWPFYEMYVAFYPSSGTADELISKHPIGTEVIGGAVLVFSDFSGTGYEALEVFKGAMLWYQFGELLPAYQPLAANYVTRAFPVIDLKIKGDYSTWDEDDAALAKQQYVIPFSYLH